ncbi:hypothetical protein CBF23_000165 [Marinomonas agarivorans]|nr:hypothetical protein CBF23_000165 [Marinomonas agarivorans]
MLSAPVDPSDNTTGFSYFVNETLTLEDYNGLFITSRMDALNFRHRLSKSGYITDWHMAGDPTLLIIRAGQLRIHLRDGSYRDFCAGDMFVARDYLQQGEVFDDTRHGHRAEVIGDETLLAVHIKLASLAE